MKVGTTIREVRKGKKVTLMELAEKTGVAQATLSRIETNNMTGTIESHVKIAEALGVTLAELYSGADARADKIEHSKKDDRSPQKLGKTSIEALTTSSSNKKMDPKLLRIESLGKISFEKEAVGIEKFIYCLKGEIKLELGNKEFLLGAGESLYFDASLPHKIDNPQRTGAELFSITSALSN